MHGEEGVAKQASICDLIESARHMRSSLSALEAENRRLRETLQAFVDMEHCEAHIEDSFERLLPIGKSALAAFPLTTALSERERAERKVVEAARCAETMLRKHADWSHGVYIRDPEKGADEDLIIVGLPDRVGIIDMADDIRDALDSLDAPDGKETT